MSECADQNSATADKSGKLFYHLQTVFLFTRSDYKTIFFPVIIFAVAVTSIFHGRALVRTTIWVWFHLLQANVSNQTFSGREDKVNKPWRPLPSGRITVRQAHILRCFLAVFCLFLSSLLGPGVVLASGALTLVEIVHDDFLFSNNPFLKNLCNVGGYLTFETGAALSMTPTHRLDSNASIALTCSALIIFTTISAQDFADVDGDKLSNRRTLPIIAPLGSRWYILSALTLWSFVLTVIWGLGPVSGGFFLAFGIFVGSRYFRLREVQEDELSYTMYNVWLAMAHVIPANARVPLLCR